METSLNLNVKVEPNSDNEASQDDFNPVEEKISSDSIVENVDMKVEEVEEPSCAPESITVKLEPTFYSSGDGQGLADTPSSSQSISTSSGSTSTKETDSTNRPKSFQDLLHLWEKNEETKEFGFFFAFCRATADCGGYDVETDTEIDSDEDSNTESKNEDLTQKDSKYYFGRNGYQWSKSPVQMHGKTKNDHVPSCTSPDEKNPYNIWNSLIDDTILQEILKWTNVKLAECRAQIGNPLYPHLADLDMIELKAFLGTFLYSVYVNLHLSPVQEMFPSEDSIFRFPIFRCITTKERFISILNCLSFGDPQLENETSDENISILFEKYVRNCQVMYKGSGYGVLGETIVPFWGSEKDEHFPMKYAERPCRDGFRLQCLFDVKTGFLHNMYIPYTDLDTRAFTEEEKKFSEPTKLALLLTQPLHGTNTNITCNKEYMSFELIDAFTKRGLTCVGTIEQSNMEIPREFLPLKKRVKGSTLYGYSENETLVSYMKRAKATIIASSMLHEPEDDENMKKPKLLKFYHRTKVAYMGDEACVKKCHRHTTLVSMALFYKMIDFSIHNALILHWLNFKRKMKCIRFLKCIAVKLCEEHLMRRALDSSVPNHIRHEIARIVGSEE